MRQAWEYAQEYPQSRELEIVQGSHSRPYQWAGWQVRVMLHAVFTIAMLCLLRFGEALGLLWEDIQFERYEGGVRVKISLIVRKTHQYGGEQGFVSSDSYFFAYKTIEPVFLKP